MFPFDMDEDDEKELATTVVSEDENEPAPEYEINFETMTLTGRMIAGIDAVKQWIRLCLETPRYIYSQYPWTYGQDFDELVGRTYSAGDLRPILERMITEALSENKEITSVSNFRVTKEGDKVTVSFIVNTIYGDTDYIHSMTL